MGTPPSGKKSALGRTQSAKGRPSDQSGSTIPRPPTAPTFMKSARGGIPLNLGGLQSQSQIPSPRTTESSPVARQAQPQSWRDMSTPRDDTSNNVKVLVRIRPSNAREQQKDYQQYCYRQGQSVMLREGPETKGPKHFMFDTVLGESSTQEDVFAVAGLPVVENCIAGYNSSVFCYGQTGAGKTFTMQGRICPKKQEPLPEDYGLMPKVFQHVFARIAEEEAAKGRDNLKYFIKCSFLEIYNEQICDLLQPTASNLQIREDIKRGCYVEGLTEQIVLNGEDMMKLLKKGTDNRTTGETKMNRESSRSHSVLTCIIESKTKGVTGMTVSKFSRLNLIDLAGSERNKASGAVGGQLKEAANINKSLTTLGRVIMNLVMQQQGQVAHVPYRDSRLTYLLQDSLGGNAKTFMIANVSPSMCSHSETLSTLRFASNAKSIVNKAVVNEEASGGIAELQDVIKRLRSELDMFHSGEADPLVELRTQLDSVEHDKENLRSQLDSKASENKQLQKQVAWLQEQLSKADRDKERFQGVQKEIVTKASLVEQRMALSREQSQNLMKSEKELLLAQLEQMDEQLSSSEARAMNFSQESEEATKSLLTTKRHLHEANEANQRLSSDAETLRRQADELDRRVASSEAEAEQLQQELLGSVTQLKTTSEMLGKKDEEVQRMEKVIRTMEAVARNHESDMLVEINRLEKEAQARQEVINTILSSANRFSSSTPVTTPYRTPQTSSALRAAYEAARAASPAGISPPVSVTLKMLTEASSPGQQPFPVSATPPSVSTPTLKPFAAPNSSASTKTPLADLSSANSDASRTGVLTLAIPEFFTPMSHANLDATPDRGSDQPPQDASTTPPASAKGLSDQRPAADSPSRQPKPNPLRLSTCDMLYSNPIPASSPIRSPDSANKPDSKGSGTPSSGGSNRWGAAGWGKENVNSVIGLVRASHVLRRNAASGSPASMIS